MFSILDAWDKKKESAREELKAAQALAKASKKN